MVRMARQAAWEAKKNKVKVEEEIKQALAAIEV